MKRWWILGLALLGAAAMGVTWSGGWEAIPDGATALASDIDTFIKDFKIEVRKRLSVESQYGTADSDDNGLMRPGSARAFAQNGAPTDIQGPGQYDSSGAAFVGTALTTDEIGTVTQDLGLGRLWVDLDGLDSGATSTADDNMLNVWNVTTNAFAPVVTRGVGGAGIGASNLIYNGSFEVTDGTTGAVASTTIPAGWTISGAPTFTYQDPTGVTEGEGLAVNITGVGAASGITQTLAGLKSSTTYVIRARVNATTAADVCDLVVTGGAVTPTTDASLTTAAYESLETIVTTTAVPASLVVKLESLNATDVCRWDEVTAFEQYANVAQPGIQDCFDSDSTLTTDYGAAVMVAVPGLSCAVTPPGPGYIVDVVANIIFDNDCGQAVSLESDLLQNGSAVAFGIASVGEVDGDSPGVIKDNGTTVVRFRNINPTPGTTLTYTLQARADDCGDVFSNDQDDDTVTAQLPASTLDVRLTPTR